MNDVNIKLAALMVELHNWMPETFKEILVTGTCERKIMLNLYDILVIEKEVKPLEALEPDKQQEIWDNAYKLIKGRLSKNGCIAVMKALYTIKALS